jgi:hypothetical protein
MQRFFKVINHFMLAFLQRGSREEPAPYGAAKFSEFQQLKEIFRSSQNFVFNFESFLAEMS